MTRDSRNPNAWKLKEIEGDSEGYKAAQVAYRLDQAVAADRRQEERDRAAFEASFVAAGGTKSGAGDAYRARRNAEAAEAAAHADEAARLQGLGATWSKV
jgi:hypothetical protein